MDDDFEVLKAGDIEKVMLEQTSKFFYFYRGDS